MKQFDFIEAGYKEGDRVYDFILNEWGEIVKTTNDLFPITVKFDGGMIYKYCSDGRYSQNHKKPRLFSNEFKIPEEAYRRPMPDLKVDDPVIVWANDGVKYHRHFSCWRNGQIVCWDRGKTSFSIKDDSNYSIPMRAAWDHWELPKDQEE